MARLWIILLVLWYRAIAGANADLPSDVGTGDDFKLDSGRKQPEAPIGELDAGLPPWRRPGQRDDSAVKPTAERPVGGGQPGSGERFAAAEDFIARLIPDHNSGVEADLAEAVGAWSGDDVDYSPVKDAIVGFVIENCLPEAKSPHLFKPWGGKRSEPTRSVIIENCVEFLRNLLQGSEEWNPDIANKYKFSAWGGKRNSDDDSGPSRLPFKAWGGKRDKSDDTLPPKRIPFRAWGGKRAPESVSYPGYPDYAAPGDRLRGSLAELDQKGLNRKKTKFHSWGGKRNTDHEDIGQGGSVADHSAPDAHGALVDIGKRAKFNSWGGKRSMGASKQEYTEDTHDDKRSFNAWGGKRSSPRGRSIYAGDVLETNRRSFNSWGGKRSDFGDHVIYRDDTPEGKRKFNSWGGKRSISKNQMKYFDNLLENKRKFNSWGGKRSARFSELEYPEEDNQNINPRGGKRTDNVEDDTNKQDFNSKQGTESFLDKKIKNILAASADKQKFNFWGVERTVLNDMPEDLIEAKRKFNSWGGKRTVLNNVSEDLLENKRKFNSWGGKRSALNDMPEDLLEVKRKFNSWGGKRTVLNNVSEDLLEDKRNFNSWGGKRIVLNDAPENFLEDKRKFNSWGGKRSALNDMPEDLLEVKRKFNSWGGKRTILNDVLEDLGEEKHKFISWGEKINFLNDKSIYPKEENENKRMFNSWGGKRLIPTDNNDNMGLNQWNFDGKHGLPRSISHWNGITQTDGIASEYKRSFNSWGGK